MNVKRDNKKGTQCNPVDSVPSCLLAPWYHLFYLRPLPCPPGTPCIPCTRGQCRPLSPLSLCPHFTMPGWCAALTAATMLCPLSTLSTSVSHHVHCMCPPIQRPLMCPPPTLGTHWHPAPRLLCCAARRPAASRHQHQQTAHLTCGLSLGKGSASKFNIDNNDL